MSGPETLIRKDPRVGIAQNLVRIYRDVLQEPVPLPLIDLLRRLQAQEEGGLVEGGAWLEAAQVRRGIVGPNLRR